MLLTWPSTSEMFSEASHRPGSVLAITDDKDDVGKLNRKIQICVEPEMHCTTRPLTVSVRQTGAANSHGDVGVMLDAVVRSGIRQTLGYY